MVEYSTEEVKRYLQVSRAMASYVGRHSPPADISKDEDLELGKKLLEGVKKTPEELRDFGFDSLLRDLEKIVNP